MAGCKGALGTLAGDLSLTVLVRQLCSFFVVPSLDMPKTKGIGELLSVDLIAPPKSNDTGELYEKSEEESPSSLCSLVVDLGGSESLR